MRTHKEQSGDLGQLVPGTPHPHQLCSTSRSVSMLDSVYVDRILWWSLFEVEKLTRTALSLQQTLQKYTNSPLSNGYTPENSQISLGKCHERSQRLSQAHPWKSTVPWKRQMSVVRGKLGSWHDASRHITIRYWSFDSLIARPLSKQNRNYR